MSIQASGTILYKNENNAIYIYLIHRPKYNDWSLPKGKSDKINNIIEHPISTAYRETLEESGFAVNIGPLFAIVEYYKKDIKKEIYYWIAEARGITDYPIDVTEIDEGKWLKLDDAIKKLTYEKDKQILKYLSNDYFNTIPIIVIRHANASNEDNQLTDKGTLQAALLSKILSAYNTKFNILSSNASRCYETILPYSSITKQEIKFNDLLGNASNNEKSNIQFLLDIINTNRPTILCTHKPIMLNYYNYLKDIIIHSSVKGKYAQSYIDEYTPNCTAYVMHTKNKEIKYIDTIYPTIE